MKTFAVQLPNGVVIEGIPEGTPKNEIALQALRNGAVDQKTFNSMTALAPEEVERRKQVVSSLTDLTSAETPQDVFNRQAMGFMSLLMGANEGRKDLLGGIGQAAREAGNAVGLVSDEDLAAFNAQEAARRSEFVQGVDTNFDVARVGGEIAPMITTPATAGRTILSKLATASGISGAQGALQFVEDGGSRGGNAALGAAVGPVAVAAPALAAEGVRRVMSGGGASRESARSAIEAFESATGGAGSPTLGQSSPGGVAGYVESVLAKAPLSARTIQKSAEKTAQQIGDRTAQLADEISKNADPIKAGANIQKGIGGFVDRFNGKYSQLDAKLDALVGKDSPVGVSSTLAQLEKLTEARAGAENLSAGFLAADPKIASLLEQLSSDAAANGSIPFSVLRELRTAVGKHSSTPALIGTPEQGQFKQLYSALSEDLERAANAAGPEAARAFTRANKFYRTGRDRIDNTLQRLAKKADPDSIVKSLQSSGREGASMLRRVKRSLKDDEWKMVSASVVSRLGKARPGAQDDIGEQFSTETFLTNWNTLNDAAKNALFSGKGMMGVRSSLDDIARATSEIRRQGDILVNRSETTRAGAQVATATGLGLSTATGNYEVAGALAGIGLLSWMGAKAMTNPKLVRWASRATKIDAENLPRHLSRLTAITQGDDPDTQASIADFLASLASDIGSFEGLLTEGE